MPDNRFVFDSLLLLLVVFLVLLACIVNQFVAYLVWC